MKRNLFVLFALLLTISLVLIGSTIRAQQENRGEMVVLGALKLKEGADVQSAEKLFNEILIPAMKDVEGLEMKVLKRLEMPNELPNDQSPDYIMMAYIKKPEVFMNLMQGERDPKLEAFGEQMKQYAGEPDIKAYMVIADTVEREEKGKQEKEKKE